MVETQVSLTLWAIIAYATSPIIQTMTQDLTKTTLTVLNLATLQPENLYPPPSHATSRRQFNTKAHFIPLQNVLCPLVATTLHFEGLVSGGWPIFNLYLSVPQRILSK